VLCEWGSIALLLQCFSAQAPEPGKPAAVRLRAGETLIVVISLADRTPAVFLTAQDVAGLLEETHRDWRAWTGDINYSGAFRDPVVRSLITLRMLTYSPSGAPVAAPTTSLPERIGGDLNWDYRYAWPRDASLGSGAFMATGKSDEAKAFLRWLEIASRLTLPRMRVLYTLMGNPAQREREIREVSGYRSSLPVRISNLASGQHQLDVYGWVVDSAWHLVSMGSGLDGPSWRMIRHLADFVCGCWREPDSGIWEERGAPRHHVSSKLLAFVALDRAVRIARHRGSDRKRAEHWEQERDALRSQLRERGWNPSLNSYAAAYDSGDVDASLLLLGMSELDQDQPERLRLTIEAVRRHLSAGGPLVYRNLPHDGTPREGAFLACSFWLIDALARAGNIDEAERLMADACTYGNELGLFPEEIDPSTRQALGNFPQALTHSSLVGAALSIESAKASANRRG
jgi:GH15 family glucan-1,4-alpha-glucosidase